MNQILFSNNASTTLATSITSGATSLAVTAGGGSLFPAITAGQEFIFTLQHIAAGVVTAFEICTCTARTGDSFTAIVRAQEGTSAQSWSAGDVVTLLPTAAGMNALIQAGQLQAQTGNFAIDTGSANSYFVTLTPTLAANSITIPIRWIAANSNTGASTFNGVPLVDQFGNNLLPNMVVGGGIYTSVWTGSVFHLINPTVQSFPQLTGQVSAPQMSPAAIAETLANAALTGVPTAPTAAIGSSSSQVATTEFANPGQSTSTNGYVTLPGGVILQWGYAQTGASGSGPVDIAVTFPIRFNINCFAVMVATTRNVAVNGQAIDGSNFSSNYSPTGCTITVDNVSGGLAAGHWFAIGF